MQCDIQMLYSAYLIGNIIRTDVDKTELNIWHGYRDCIVEGADRVQVAISHSSRYGIRRNL
jgi:hypothetical protein